MTVNSVEEDPRGSQIQAEHADERRLSRLVYAQPAPSGSERQELSTPFQAEDEDDDEENEVPEDEEINNMIASRTRFELSKQL